MSVVVREEPGTITVPAATLVAPIRRAAEGVPGVRVRKRRHAEVQAGTKEVRVAVETMCGVEVDGVDIMIEAVE